MGGVGKHGATLEWGWEARLGGSGLQVLGGWSWVPVPRYSEGLGPEVGALRFFLSPFPRRRWVLTPGSWEGPGVPERRRSSGPPGLASLLAAGSFRVSVLVSECFAETRV